MSNIRHVTVSEDDDGQRLDRWLKKAVPDLPYVLAQKLIRKGQIRIDGKRAKMDTKLAAGQSVKIPAAASEIEKTAVKKRKGELSPQDIKFIHSLVIYDDGDVIALNKPAGLAVQGGSKTKRHIDGFLDGLKNDQGVRPRLVHRLDKDTSGVLLLARSANVARELGAAFKGRDIKKIYFAIVMGRMDPAEGTIKAPLIKGGGGQKEKMIVDEKEGKMALTDYVMLDYAGQNMSFVAFWPRTGRTHQIRAHAALMECPILGDGKYGGPEARTSDMDLPRTLHLHARRIILKHPTRKGVLDISAPLSPDLQKSWKALGFNANYKEDPFADS